MFNFCGKSCPETGGSSLPGRPKTRRLFCPTSQAHGTKIFRFTKGRNNDLKKSARLDTGDVMAIRHQT
jgi:ribosomal protein L44E